ncbi:MAG: hypothetical protein R3C59_26150 [Planctomycetaceae bacterium]
MTKAPPVGLEEVVKTVEKTLKLQGGGNAGGNAGGNIPDDVLSQLAAWAKLYGRAHRLCRTISKQAE